MMIPLKGEDIAYLRGRNGTLAAAKTLGRSFFLETEAEEIVLFTENDDLIVASAFGIGERIERGLGCTIYQIRELEAPLIVLPRGHPASPRLKTVVSIGPIVRLSCRIQPGTHPEQEVLCSSDEFDGLEIRAVRGGMETLGFTGDIAIARL